MGRFFILIPYFFKTLWSLPCLSYVGSSGECLACSEQYYQLNPSTDVFPDTDCLPKGSEKLVLKILIITPGVDCDAECRPKFSEVHTSFQIGLKELSFLASRQVYSEVEVFLASGIHHILRMTSEYKPEIFFRRVNASIKLGPLSCDMLNQKDLCIPAGHQARINIKTNNLHIFVSHKLIITNIKFTALEQHYSNSSDPCQMSFTENCCSIGEDFYLSKNSSCSLNGLRIDFEIRTERYFGLFNLESFFENTQTNIQIIIENSDFIYFFLITQKRGFTSLFSVLFRFNFQINISNCTFSDSFYLKGLIYIEKTLDEANLDKWFANIGDEKIALFLSGALQLKNKLAISNSSFLNYNLPQIYDNRKNEEKCLLTIYSSDTEFFLTDIKFYNLLSQDPENQALINIVGPSSDHPMKNGCILISRLDIKNISNLIMLNVAWADCIEIDFLSAQKSLFQHSHALILRSSNVLLKNSYFIELNFYQNKNLLNIDTCHIELEAVFIAWSLSPRIFVDSSDCKLRNLSAMKIVFSQYLFYIYKTDFTMESSNLTEITVSENQQDIVILLQENCSVFKSVHFQNISASTLKFFDKTNTSTFAECTFVDISDLSYFIAAESVYLAYNLINSSIKSCAFLNFYFSLNGNRFAVQPKMNLYALNWSNFTVRVGYFCAFSNVELELKDSVISDMVGIKKDNFVRFFYIGRSSSFLMENSQVIDCGYKFEPILNDYAYNYQLILGQFISSFFRVVNSTFITYKPLSLKTGFIALNRNLGKVSIVNCSFIVASIDNLSHNGVTFTTTTEIEFTNNTLINIRCPYERISAVHEGGAVFMYGEETGKFYKNTKKATVTDNYFENCTCRGGGGLTIVNYHVLIIKNNLFKHNFAWYQIGSLGIFSSTSVVLQGNMILESYSPSFGAIKIEDVKFVSIQSLTVGKSMSNTTAVIFIFNVFEIQISNLITDQIETNSNGGLMYIGYTNLTVLASCFTNIRTSFSGGVFFVDTFSNFSLQNCVIKEVAAFSGGVLAVFIGGYVFLSNISIYNVQSNSDGAAFLFEQYIMAKLLNVSLENVTTEENGIVTFETADETTSIIINNISCYKNKAKSGSCIYAKPMANISVSYLIAQECIGIVLKVISDLKIWVFLKQFFIKNNRGEDIVRVDNIFLILENFLYYNNIAEKAFISMNKIPFGSLKGLTFLGKNITLSNAKIITAVKFDLSSLSIEDLFFSFLNSQSQTTVIQAQNSEITLRSGVICGSLSLDNLGAIRLIDTFIEASDIEFFYNHGVCVKGSGLGGSFKRLIMSNNKAIDEYHSTDFEYISSSSLSVSLTLEQIISKIEMMGTFVMVFDYSKLIVYKCTLNSSLPIDTKINESIIEFKGVEAINVLNLQVNSCEFYSLMTKGRGSAISDFNDALVFTSSLVIFNSSFSNCSSYKGAGVLFIFNKKKILFENNSFVGNTAKSELNMLSNEFEGVGAVGIILCQPAAYMQNEICNISLINNIFENNFAFYHSPTFYINNSLNIVESITYMNNFDQINFTNIVTSYPLDVKMKFPLDKLNQKFFNLNSDPTLSDISFKSLSFSENINVLKLNSGDSFNLTFFITDSQNNIIVFDDFSFGSIEVSNSSKYQIKIEDGLTKAKKGWLNFSNTRIFAWPDSTVAFEVTFEIPKITLIYNPDSIKLKRTIYVHFTPCLVGEIVLHDLRCLECPLNTFSSEDPMIALSRNELKIIYVEAQGYSPSHLPIMKCSPCLKGAFCPGGWAIFPSEGYWRSNNVSKTIIECFIPKACIGYDLTRPVSDNLLGLCQEGHYGNLCHECSKGYGKLNSYFPCEPCTEVVKGAFTRLVFASLMVVSYSIFGSYMYSKQRKEEGGFLIIYFRIGITFSQITSLITFVKINWPLLGLNQFLSMSSSFLSLTSEDVLFNDCLIEKSSLEGREKIKVKLMISIFLPILLFFVSSIIWLLYFFLIRNQKLGTGVICKDLYIRIFVSLIISVFLFHPLIIKTCFNLLNCFVLDPSESEEEFLFAYPNFSCWDSFHIKIIITAVLPGIIIWGIAFPLTLLCILVKKIEIKNSKTALKFDNDSRIFKINPAKKKTSIKPEPVHIKTNSFGTEMEDSLPKPQAKKKSTRIHKLKKFVIKSNLSQFLYEGYKEKYSFWECFIYLKNFILTMLINFNQIIGFEMVNLLILLVLFLHLYYHVNNDPYILKNLNTLETLCLLGSIIIFISVIMLQANLDAQIQNIFSILIFVTYSFCLGFTSFYIVSSVKRLSLLGKCVVSFKEMVSSVPLRRR